jgi:hypothetical protein
MAVLARAASAPATLISVNLAVGSSNDANAVNSDEVAAPYARWAHIAHPSEQGRFTGVSQPPPQKRDLPIR